MYVFNLQLQLYPAKFFVLFLLLHEVPEKSMFLFCLCYVGQLKGVIYE